MGELFPAHQSLPTGRGGLSWGSSAARAARSSAAPWRASPATSLPTVAPVRSYLTLRRSPPKNLPTPPARWDCLPSSFMPNVAGCSSVIFLSTLYCNCLLGYLSYQLFEETALDLGRVAGTQNRLPERAPTTPPGKEDHDVQILSHYQCRSYIHTEDHRPGCCTDPELDPTLKGVRNQKQIMEILPMCCIISTLVNDNLPDVFKSSKFSYWRKGM